MKEDLKVQKKGWKDYSHEERIESFSKYVKFKIAGYIRENIKVWETAEEKNQELMPYNAITGRHYNGINSILLESEAKKRGFENGVWVNQEQARLLGIKIKEEEKDKAVKIAYIRKFEMRIKKGEDGQPLTTPQLDKDGNPKINPKTNEAYYQYISEKVELEKPILETAYLYHASQCENLTKITAPTLENNPNPPTPKIGEQIDLYPQTKEQIINYLKQQQEFFKVSKVKHQQKKQEKRVSPQVKAEKEKKQSLKRRR